MPRRIVNFVHDHPWASAFAVVGFIVSGATAPLMQLSWTARHPAAVDVKNVEIEKLKDGGFLLTVTLRGPAVPDCLRISQHLLTRHPPGETPDYIPLGSALNGLGYAASVTDLDVLLKVHPNTAHGLWYYVDRSAYLCVEWPGLIIVKQLQSPPYPIVFPDPDR